MRVEGGGAEGKTEKKVPGFERTSYASLTAAIFCSEPPLSGCAVFAAVRLYRKDEMMNSEGRTKRTKPS
jgi:hypothetical protein